MTAVADFKAMSKDIRERVDVLVQLSEIYYLMCKLKSSREYKRGGKTFVLIRHALGFELTARLYRLLESAEGNHHFAALVKALGDDTFLAQLFAKVNKSGGKSWVSYMKARDSIAASVSSLRRSAAFQSVEIFRHRFVGHRQPMPRRLKHLPPTADVQELKIAEFRYLVTRIGPLAQRLATLEGHKGFNWKVSAELAKRDAQDLWDPKPDPLSFLDER